MAKNAKYIATELDDFKQKKSWEESNARYKFQRKVNKLSDVEILDKIFSGEIKSTQGFFNTNRIDVWRDVINNQRLRVEPYKTILKEVVKKSDTFLNLPGNVRAIEMISQYSNEIIRPISEWKPKRSNAHYQLYDLLRYLFAEYPVPVFLDKGFICGYAGYNSENIEYIELFIHIGKGRSLKKFPLAPDLKLNNKVYHYLLNTPENLTFFESFRRAQILSMGGDDKLVNAILESKLGRRTSEKQEDFWITVIQFLINTPMLDSSRISPIIDYIEAMKYIPTRRLVNGIYQTVQPEQPGFTMKGRTAESILRQVDEWHEILNRDTRRTTKGSKTPITKWDGLKVNNWAKSVGKDVNKIRYDIIQLLTSAELSQEGRDLGHCVSSYAGSCLSGRCGIFSLRQASVQNGMYSRPMLTIEVNSSFQVVQVRGKSNRLPTKYEMMLVAEWADMNRLSISNWVKSN
jgi:hypothetical protein